MDVAAEVAVEVVVAAEQAGLQRVGLEGQAQSDFPVVAAVGRFELFEGAGGRDRGEGAGRGVVLQNGMLVGVGRAPTRGILLGLARGGFGPAIDELRFVVGVVVVRARVDPGAEDFESDAPLVVVARIRVAVIIVGVRTHDDGAARQELPITDAEIAFFLVLVRDGRAGIREQQAGFAGIPQRNEQVAESLGFRIARLEADGQFGRRPFLFRGLRGGRRALGFFGLGRLRRRRQGAGQKNHQHERPQANPATSHGTLRFAQPPAPTSGHRTAHVRIPRSRGHLDPFAVP